MKKTGTFVRTNKHSHTQQLTEKDTGHINQILKHVLMPFPCKLQKIEKVITLHVSEDHKEKIRQNHLTVSGRNLYKKEKKK